MIILNILFYQHCSTLPNMVPQTGLGDQRHRGVFLLEKDHFLSAQTCNRVYNCLLRSTHVHENYFPPFNNL